MNLANQKQLFQATNQGLLAIRQSEVQYYQSINVSFGTQAAMIGGFTYGVFTFNQAVETSGKHYIATLTDCYWVAAACTIALAVHVILCTTLMQVLGPGLALNGPIGSVARATEGMRLEQKQIIFSFIAMVMMFSVATVLSCWVIMSVAGAAGCTIAFGFAAYNWYKYCQRIYLRFYWDKEEEAGWNSGGEGADEEDPAGNDRVDGPKRRESVVNSFQATKAKRSTTKGIFGFFRKTKARRGDSGQDDDSSSGDGGSQKSASTKSSHTIRTTTSLAQFMRGRGSGKSEATTETGVALTDPSVWKKADGSRGIAMEGYLSKQSTSQKRLKFRSVPWKRRYFTLTSTCNLFVYKSRQDFRNDPKKPIYTRPLQLMDYYIDVQSITAERAFESKTVLSGGGDEDDVSPFRFQMTLVLRENVHDVKNLTVIGHDATPGEVFNVITRNGSSNTLNSEVRIRGRSPSADTDVTGTSTSLSPSHAQMHRNHWVLRCDTEEELQQWVSVINAMCPSCFAGL